MAMSKGEKNGLKKATPPQELGSVTPSIEQKLSLGLSEILASGPRDGKTVQKVIRNTNSHQDMKVSSKIFNL